MRRSARMFFAIAMFVLFPYLIELLLRFTTKVHNHFLPNSNLLSLSQSSSTVEGFFEAAVWLALRFLVCYRIIVESPDEEIFEDIGSSLVPVNNIVSGRNLVNFYCALDTVKNYRPIEGQREWILSKSANNGQKLTDIIATNLSLTLPDPLEQTRLKTITSHVLNHILQPAMNNSAVPLLHIYPKEIVWNIIRFLPIGCSASEAADTIGRKLLFRMFNHSVTVQRIESTLAFIVLQKKQMLDSSSSMLDSSWSKREHIKQIISPSKKGYLNGNIKPNSAYLESLIEKSTGIENAHVKLVVAFLYGTRNGAGRAIKTKTVQPQMHPPHRYH